MWSRTQGGAPTAEVPLYGALKLCYLSELRYCGLICETGWSAARWVPTVLCSAVLRLGHCGSTPRSSFRHKCMVYTVPYAELSQFLLVQKPRRANLPLWDPGVPCWPPGGLGCP